MRLALYQPDIPQNLGAALRLGACLGVSVDVIEPCGFPLTDAGVRRAAMDYGALADLARHATYEAFAQACPGRVVLLSTRAAQPLHAFDFRSDDTLLLGRESAGVPDAVHEAADARVLIPILPPARSLNVTVAAAIALSEALRQTGGFPTLAGNG